jgi:hypothetical protein
MHALLLKAAAALITLGTAAASAVYVTGHVKNVSAPLHPSVIGASSVSAAAGGRLHLTPSVGARDVQAVTSTYAS